MVRAEFSAHHSTLPNLKENNMFGIEKAYCQAMISALLDANQSLLNTTINDATNKSFVAHKGDTLGLDQIPENAITQAVLQGFDQHSCIISEERGWDSNPLAASGLVEGAKTFFTCDPCDRSNELCDFLKNRGQPEETVGDVLSQKNSRAIWAKKYSRPTSITGANTALTCIRRGLPIGSVIINFVTQEIFLACSAGTFTMPISPKKTAPNFEQLTRGKKILFEQPDPKSHQHFITFNGKPDRGYPANLHNTQLATDTEIETNLIYDKPGGPSRILYLTHLQPKTSQIGFILANGEKIGEWSHWLTFARFSLMANDASRRPLRIFEVTPPKSELIDGVLMTPSSQYSVFKDTKDGQVAIDVDHLQSYNNPSKYRSTMVITPADNSYIIKKVQQFGYRELRFPPPQNL